MSAYDPTDPDHQRGTRYVDAVIPAARHRRRVWPWVLGALLLVLLLLPLLGHRTPDASPETTYRVDTLTRSTSTGEVGGAASAGTAPDGGPAVHRTPPP